MHQSAELNPETAEELQQLETQFAKSEGVGINTDPLQKLSKTSWKARLFQLQ